MSSSLKQISSIIPDTVIDLRYANNSNISKKQLYSSSEALLRPKTLTALKRAAAVLRLKGLRLVIWDAYRPPAVQAILRSVCDDERYVTKISNHSRGISVDITLADSQGNYLDMGTDFDKFSAKAHVDSSALSDTQRQNRKILRQALEVRGFRQLPTEWWHFDYIKDDVPEIIDKDL